MINNMVLIKKNIHEDSHLAEELYSFLNYNYGYGGNVSIRSENMKGEVKHSCALL